MKGVTFRSCKSPPSRYYREILEGKLGRLRKASPPGTFPPALTRPGALLPFLQLLHKPAPRAASPPPCRKSRLRPPNNTSRQLRTFGRGRRRGRLRTPGSRHRDQSRRLPPCRPRAHPTRTKKSRGGRGAACNVPGRASGSLRAPLSGRGPRNPQGRGWVGGAPSRKLTPPARLGAARDAERSPLRKGRRRNALRPAAPSPPGFPLLVPAPGTPRDRPPSPPRAAHRGR